MSENNEKRPSEFAKTDVTFCFIQITMILLTKPHTGAMYSALVIEKLVINCLDTI